MPLVAAAYRIYNDDGSESTATAKGSQSTQTTLDTDTNYHARIRYQSDGTVATAKSSSWEYSHESGSWTVISTSSSVVRAVNSSNLTDEGDTTRRLGGSNTFVTPNAQVCEDGSTTIPATAATGEEWECLLSFLIVDADVSHGDEILLRNQFANAVHTTIPDIDVNKPGSSRRVFNIG